ncbi:MAG: caspase family protein, partial [Bacteroidota bacterium]
HKTLKYDLDPTYEPTEKSSIEENTKIFRHLQDMNRQGLVVPDPPHKDMYFAAVENGSCSLTPTGQFYWDLVVKQKI